MQTKPIKLRETTESSLHKHCTDAQLQHTWGTRHVFHKSASAGQENRPAHMLSTHTHSRAKLPLLHNTATTFPETGVKFKQSGVI